MQPKKKSSSNLVIHIPVAPVPAARPRVTRWGSYYPATYKNWMAAAYAVLPETTPMFPAHVPLYVNMGVVCKRPSKPVNVYPVGDVDNYAKAALDAIVKRGYLHDDKQIVELIVIKRYAERGEEPHTRVAVTENT